MISFEGDPIQSHSMALRKWLSLRLMEFLIQSVPDQQGGSVLVPGSNLPSCSPVTGEMLGLLIGVANRQSMKVLRKRAAVHFSLFPVKSFSDTHPVGLDYLLSSTMWDTPVCLPLADAKQNFTLIIVNLSEAEILLHYSDTLLPSSVSNQVHRFLSNVGCCATDWPRRLFSPPIMQRRGMFQRIKKV